MLTYAIDVIFIARLGEDQLAASALAIALFGLVLWALSGLTGAVAPVAAAELGERAPRCVRCAARSAWRYGWRSFRALRGSAFACCSAR